MQSEFACGRVNMCKVDSEDLCQTTLPEGEQTGGESSFFSNLAEDKEITCQKLAPTQQTL